MTEIQKSGENDYEKKIKFEALNKSIADIPYYENMDKYLSPKPMRFNKILIGGIILNIISIQDIQLTDATHCERT